jgi:hypothetical protein
VKRVTINARVIASAGEARVKRVTRNEGA